MIKLFLILVQITFIKQKSLSASVLCMSKLQSLINDMSDFFAELDTFQMLEEYFLPILCALEYMATDMIHF